VAPREAAAQFTNPCDVTCAAALGATGAVAATGAVVAIGRLSGGVSTTAQAAWTWGASFAGVVGAGIALQRNGERQERAIYGAALGSAVGSLVSLGLTATGSRHDGARLLAASLIGASAGAILGGVYGAASYRDATSGFPLTATVTF
jgi:hypothetical protein